MSTAERILRVLAEGPQLTRALAAHLQLRADNISSVCRCLKRRGLISSAEGAHGITEAGRTLLEKGRRPPCGGPRKGRAARSRSSLRQRAWTVALMMDVFTVDDLLSVVCDGEEGNAPENIGNYCEALRRAGILIKTPRGEKYLIRAERRGPLAPSYNRAEKVVTDRNTGEIIAIGGLR